MTKVYLVLRVNERVSECVTFFRLDRNYECMNTDDGNVIKH